MWALRLWRLVEAQAAARLDKVIAPIEGGATRLGSNAGLSVTDTVVFFTPPGMLMIAFAASQRAREINYKWIRKILHNHVVFDAPSEN